jgi:hypothetical protein
MAQIINHLSTPVTLSSFFGPLTLQPGMNTEVDDKRWKNCKRFSEDAKILLQKKALEELN